MENNLEIYKYCFEYWKNNDYNNEVFVELANRFGFKKNKLKFLFRSYIINDFNCSKEEEEMYLDYLLETDISLEIYRKMFNSVVGTTKEQRIVVIEKYCYEKCLEVSWSKKGLEDISKKLGIAVTTIKRYAKNHMERNNISIEVRDSAISAKMKERTRNSRQNLLMDALCAANTKEEIIKVIEDSGLKPKALKLVAADYVNIYRKEEGEELLIKLKRKIDIYREHLIEVNKKIKEQEMIRQLEIMKEELLKELPKARVLVESFVYGDYKLITDYVKIINVELEEFKRYVKIVEMYDNNLFLEYMNKVEELKRGRYLYITNELKRIVGLIENGIVEDGNKREFDLLDYYFIIKLDIRKLIKFAKENLSSKDVQILTTFVRKNRGGKQYSDIEINNYINSIIEIGSKINKYGRPIVNTGRIITREEKIAIIDYLHKKEIPINVRTTNLLLRRYLNGSVDLFEGKNKKRIKTNN